jgi:hypothetical protein
MYYEGRSLVWKRSLAHDVLAAVQVRPAAALVPALQVALYTGVTNPTPDSVFADFTEPAFSGYSRFTVAVPAPLVTVDTSTTGLLLQCLFTSTSATPYVTANVNGYFLTDAGGGYYGAERFDTPFPFAHALDFLTLNAMMLMELRPEGE